MKLCVIASGSSGNSIYIEGGNTKLLVDAGLSGKRITNALKSIDIHPKDLDAILITHEHKDHIIGSGVMSRRFDVPIYANEKTWEAIKPSIGEIDEKNQKLILKSKMLHIKDIAIENFQIPHDAVDPVGFSLYYNNKKITTATDIGFMDRDLIRKLIGCNLLVLESNHDVEMLKAGRYPWNTKRRILSQSGHLSNEQAGKTVRWLCQDSSYSFCHFVLGHLSGENNFPELALETVASIMAEKGINIKKDLKLDILNRGKRSSVFQV